MVEKKLKHRGSILLPVFIILFLTFFYKFSALNYSPYVEGKKYLFCIFVSFLILSKGKIELKGMLFKKRLILYGALIAVNCVTCYLFRHQSIMVSLRAWQAFFLVFLYVAFRHINLSIRSWEKVLYVLYLLILVGYILQNLFIDAIIFDLDISRAKLEIEQRVRIYSDGILFLGTLFCWNKYLVSSRKKFLLLFVLGLLMIFLQGYRILVASLGFVLIVLYFRVKKISLKSLFIFLSVTLSFGIAALSVPMVQDKIVEMQDRAEREEMSGDSDVRTRDLLYVYSSHFIDEKELITGSGMPLLSFEVIEATGEKIARKGESEYSGYMSELAADMHFYTVDLGLLGLSWVAGIPFAILFIALLISMARVKVSPEYYYIGMYSIMVVLCGFTNALSYKHGNVIYLALLMMILELAHRQYQRTPEKPRRRISVRRKRNRMYENRNTDVTVQQ